jgi:hypothetical protein
MLYDLHHLGGKEGSGEKGEEEDGRRRMRWKEIKGKGRGEAGG